MLDCCCVCLSSLACLPACEDPVVVNLFLCWPLLLLVPGSVSLFRINFTLAFWTIFGFWILDCELGFCGLIVDVDLETYIQIKKFGLWILGGYFWLLCVQLLDYWLRSGFVILWTWYCSGLSSLLNPFQMPTHILLFIRLRPAAALRCLQHSLTCLCHLLHSPAALQHLLHLPVGLPPFLHSPADPFHRLYSPADLAADLTHLQTPHLP